MKPEVAKIVAEQIQATAKELAAQLTARSRKEAQPQRYLFDALCRLNELAPVDAGTDAIAAGLNKFAEEYALTVPNFAGSDTSTRQTGWLN